MFNYYLDAWRYARHAGIPLMNIKRVNLRTWKIVR